MNETVFCVSCGTQVDASAKFCLNCGAPQEPVESDPPAEEPTAIVEPQSETPTSSAAPTELTPVEPVEPTSPEPREEEPETATDPPPPPPPPPPAPSQARPTATERLEQTAPGAKVLAGELGKLVSAPGVALAGLGALTTTAVMFALGLVLAIVLPENSLLSLATDGSGTVSEAFRQTAAFTLAPFEVQTQGGIVFRVTPAIFGFLLLGVCTVAVAMLWSLLPNTRDLKVRARLAWGAGTGLPLAILFLIIGLLAGDGGGNGTDEFKVELMLGSVFLLALLWGVAGGTLGTLWALRREGQLQALAPPAWLRQSGSVLRAALVPLVILIALSAVAGTGVWIVQTFRDAGDIQSQTQTSDNGEERSTLGATIDHSLYVVDHGVHFAELGALTEFHDPTFGALGLPAPVEKVNEVTSGESIEGDFEAGTLTPAKGGFRLFDYSGAVPVVLFIPSLFLILLTALLALYAGFSVARSRPPGPIGIGAAWGALVGPVWAIAMVILNALVQKDYMGKANGDSVFALFLLGGVMLGALGGLLAAQSRTDRPADAAGAPPPAGTPPPPAPPPPAPGV